MEMTGTLDEVRISLTDIAQNCMNNRTQSSLSDHDPARNRLPDRHLAGRFIADFE